MIRPLRPFVEVSPESCAEVRRALDVALAAFDRWGINPSPSTWIQEAAAWLDAVARTGSIGSTKQDLRRTSIAIAKVVDLYHISTTLGDDSHHEVASELSKLVRGGLLEESASARGKDFLSQFWFGALLAQSKLQPQIITTDVANRSKPDFLIVRGGVRFAVEVKRPHHPDSARRAVLRAARQLRSIGRPGILVIDATECTSVDPWAIYNPATGLQDRLREEFAALHHSNCRLVTTYSRSGKFSHVAMLMTFARYWHWQIDDAGSYRRDAGILLRAFGFPYLWSRQVTRLTIEIQDALHEGLYQLTGNRPRFTHT